MFHEIFLTGASFTKEVMEQIYLLFSLCLLFTIICIYYFSISLFFLALEHVQQRQGCGRQNSRLILENTPQC